MQPQRRRLLLLAGALVAPRVAALDLLEDHDYRAIDPQPVADPARIEVLEFFYYGCRWCNEFEPYLNEWLQRKPKDVLFGYQPAIRNRRWLPLTKAYFALQSMGQLPRLHAALYRAYHRDERNLEDEAELVRWVAKQGIARAHFEMVLNSDQTMARVEEAREATYAYTVETTPSVVVDGRYLTSSGMAGGVSELMPIVEDLIQFARQERRSPR